MSDEKAKKVKFKDTDFLHATARIKVLETRLLTSRDLRRMAEASNVEESYKIVNDAGIGTQIPLKDYELALRESLLESYELIDQIAGYRDLFRLFRYSYDGLNLKAVIKAQAMDAGPRQAMTELGNLTPEVLLERFHAKKLEGIHPIIARGALEAEESLAKSGDPQTVDVIIDKAVLEAMREKAGEYDSPFLQRLIRTRIDIANIRCLVRSKRMGKESAFFRKLLVEGGDIPLSKLIEAFPKGMEQVTEMLYTTRYGSFLEPSFEKLRTGGPLTVFEKLCDSYLVEDLDGARRIPFGIEPVLAYLCAKESEVQAVRIVLASKLAGVAPEEIMERLRQTYA